MIEYLSIGSKLLTMLGSLIKWVADFFQSEQKLNRDHDIAMFRKLDAIADEPRLDDILNARIPNSRFRMEDHYVLADLIEALRRIENTFLDSMLKTRGSELASELEQLLDCVMRTFSPNPGGFLGFYSGSNIPQDRYDVQWNELIQKIDKAWEAYKKFRHAVKERLKT